MSSGSGRALRTATQERRERRKHEITQLEHRNKSKAGLGKLEIDQVAPASLLYRALCACHQSRRANPIAEGCSPPR